MSTPDSEQDRLEQKIARQIVAMQYPHGKRTNGEMNDDAHFIRQSQYFKNIADLIKADRLRTAKVLREEIEKEYRDGTATK